MTESFGSKIILWPQIRAFLSYHWHKWPVPHKYEYIQMQKKEKFKSLFTLWSTKPSQSYVWLIFTVIAALRLEKKRHRCQMVLEDRLVSMCQEQIYFSTTSSGGTGRYLSLRCFCALPFSERSQKNSRPSYWFICCFFLSFVLWILFVEFLLRSILILCVCCIRFRAESELRICS